MGLDFTYESHKSKFRIIAENKQAALLAVKSLDQGERLGYVQPGEMADCRTLEEVIEVWGWYVKTDDETGDIIALTEAPEKLGSAEMQFWNALAPYVQTGSVLQCIGPEGEHWRWVFAGAKCTEVEGAVRWSEGEPDPDGGLHHGDAEKLREFARDKYAAPSDDDIEIDPGAQLSVGDEGAFVHGWLWVSFEDAGVGLKPHIQVEYDLKFWGGDYSGVGDFLYIPLSEIEDGNEEEMVHKAVKARDVDPAHIIHYTMDELYTEDGAPYEEDEDE